MPPTLPGWSACSPSPTRSATPSGVRGPPRWPPTWSSPPATCPGTTSSSWPRPSTGRSCSSRATTIPRCRPRAPHRSGQYLRAGAAVRAARAPPGAAASTGTVLDVAGPADRRPRRLRALPARAEPVQPARVPPAGRPPAAPVGRRSAAPAPSTSCSPTPHRAVSATRTTARTWASRRCTACSSGSSPAGTCTATSTPTASGARPEVGPDDDPQRDPVPAVRDHPRSAAPTPTGAGSASVTPAPRGRRRERLPARPPPQVLSALGSRMLLEDSGDRKALSFEEVVDALGRVARSSSGGRSSRSTRSSARSTRCATSTRISGRPAGAAGSGGSGSPRRHGAARRCRHRRLPDRRHVLRPRRTPPGVGARALELRADRGRRAAGATPSSTRRRAAHSDLAGKSCAAVHAAGPARPVARRRAISCTRRGEVPLAGRDGRGLGAPG